MSFVLLARFTLKTAAQDNYKGKEIIGTSLNKRANFIASKRKISNKLGKLEEIKGKFPLIKK